MTTFSEEFGEKVGRVLRQLNCAICLEPFEDPVTLTCGDSFCRSCYRQHKDTISSNKNQGNDQLPTNFSCPTCRKNIGPRAPTQEIEAIKLLGGLARKTTEHWHQLFGKPFVLPHINMPLSQSTVASAEMHTDNDKRDPPVLSVFGEQPSVVSSCVKESEFKSPPLLYPVGIKQKAVSLSPIANTVVSASTRTSLPTAKKGRCVFSTFPDDDPYRFKSTQSQEKEANEKNASSDNITLLANEKETPSENDTISSKPIKGRKKVSKAKPKTISRVSDALSSQNPEIQRMRQIVKAAEDYELPVEFQPSPEEESNGIKFSEVFLPKKRMLKDDHMLDTGDMKGSVEKKKKTVTTDKIPKQNRKDRANLSCPLDFIFSDSSESSNKERSVLLSDSLSGQKLQQDIENQKAGVHLGARDNTQPVGSMEIAEKENVGLCELSKKIDEDSHKPNISNSSNSAKLGKNRLDVICSAESEKSPIFEKTFGKKQFVETKDALTETPSPSNYILIFPCGNTVMSLITKQVEDSSVQAGVPNEEMADASVGNNVRFCDAGVQTDVPVVDKTTAKSIFTEVCVQTEEVGKLEVGTNTGLPVDVDNDEGSMYWSVPQEGQRPRSESTLLPPTAATLCPDSLAQAAALCQADVENDDMADTIVANSDIDLDFADGSVNMDEESKDVILPTPKESGAKSPMRVGQTQAHSSDVVASSVDSFLRHDTGMSQVGFEKFSPLFASRKTPESVVNAKTPATEVLKSENRTSLTSFMNRLSSQVSKVGGAGNAAQSTPSVASSRKSASCVATNEPVEETEPKNSVLPAVPVFPPAQSVLPPSQFDLPQLLRDARSDSKMISLTSSGCSGQDIYANSLKTFCDIFTCRLTGSFLVKATTHVVIRTVPGHDVFRVCDRTMKFLLGVAARRWVVSIQWVIDSVRERRILPEEQYEITGDTSTAPDHLGPSKSRSSRIGLFDNLEICCSEDLGSQTFTRNDVFQLIELCGGTRVDSPDAFSYRRGTKRIIAIVEPTNMTGQTISPTAEELKRRKDMYRRFKAVILSVDWILDSISRCTRIDASQHMNAAYCLFPCPPNELAALANSP